MSATSADLVVLGAGPAGLAAAWRAARSGRSVVVLEREDHVGGAAASYDVAGVRVDVGSHRLHPATPPALMADLRGLLGADLQTRPRHGRLRLGDRWVAFPLRGGELVRALPPRLLTGIARDAALAPLRHVGAARRGSRERSSEETYADVLRTGLGPATYEALYAPYALKLWGLPGERVSADQARKRVTADSPVKVAARVLRGGRTGRGTGQGRVFHYPRRGFGQISEALADAAVAAGAEVRLSSPATAVRLDGARPRVTTASDEVDAAHVLSTLPLPLLARLATPPAPAQAHEAAATLTFRAMVVVHVVHEGGRWTPYDAHYLPGPETPVTRVSEPANYRVSADDPADRTVLTAELPCAVGDAVWTAADDELAGLVLEGLARAGLPPVRLRGTVVRRLPHVYPVYEVGYARALAGLDAWAHGLDGVTTFGRLGLFAHDNTHHAVATAYAAVDALRPGPDGVLRRDPDAWSASRERFALHVVED